jgi:hypothetical protein
MKVYLVRAEQLYTSWEVPFKYHLAPFLNAEKRSDCYMISRINGILSQRRFSEGNLSLPSDYSGKG